MDSFKELSRPLQNAISDLGFSSPTPIQSKAFPLILSGRDMVGIAQTGTGKTMAYMLPILQNLKIPNGVSNDVGGHCKTNEGATTMATL